MRLRHDKVERRKGSKVNVLDGKRPRWCVSGIGTIHRRKPVGFRECKVDQVSHRSLL